VNQQGLTNNENYLKGTPFELAW